VAPQTQPLVAKPVTEMKETAQNITEQGKGVAQGLQKLGSGLVASTAHGKQLQPAVKQDEKVYAAVSYLPLLAIACIIFKPNSSFVRLHGRQGLMLFILFFLTLILVAIVTAFPVIGAILGVLFGLVPFGLMLLGFYSIYLALSGYWWKIPVIGQMAEIIPVESLAKMAKENLAGQVNIAKEDYENRQETLGKEKAENKPESVEKPVVTQNATPTFPESPNSVVKEESPKVEDKIVEDKIVEEPKK